MLSKEIISPEEWWEATLVELETLRKRTGEFVKSIDDYARKAINDLNIRLARAARASQESVLENTLNLDNPCLVYIPSSTLLH